MVYYNFDCEINLITFFIIKTFFLSYLRKQDLRIEEINGKTIFTTIIIKRIKNISSLVLWPQVV